MTKPVKPSDPPTVARLHNVPIQREAEFDPGATLCGHGPRHPTRDYLGGGLWVCFECLVKAIGRPTKEPRT